MTRALNSNTVNEIVNQNAVIEENLNQNPSDLTIHIRSKVTHESPLTKEVKLKKREQSPALSQILNNVLKEKNESASSQLKWKTSDEVELSGVSNMTLHNFILKAEQLGKKVTYEKTLTVKLTD